MRSVLVVLAVLVSCLPLFNGFPKGHDWTFELVRVAEYGHALEAGQFPPYWAGNLYGGYGSPIFLFYAPLFMLVANIFANFLGSIAWGSTLALLFFTALSAVFVRRMALSVLDSGDAASHAAARVAVYLYVLNPYLVGDKLLRNANAEFAALCIVPLALWGLFCIRTARWRGMLLLAAGVCLMTLAHNLTALIWIFLLSIACLVLYPQKYARDQFLYACGAIALGLLMSSFFWIPALILKSQVQLEQMTTGRFDFHQNFPSFDSLFGYEFYSIGLLPLAVIVVAVVVLIFAQIDRLRRVIFCSVSVATIFLLLLQLRYSTWLWEHLPMLPLFQFPWRMMGPLSLMVSLIGAFLFFKTARGWNGRRIMAVELGVLLLCIANAIPNLSQYEPLEAAAMRSLQNDLSAASIRENFEPATVLEEYLPKGATLRATQFRPAQDPILGSNPSVRLTILSNSMMFTSFEVYAVEPAAVDVARWAFPVWAVAVNGVAVPPQSGILKNLDIAVPAGRSEIQMKLQPPASRMVGLVASLLGVLVWILIMIRDRRATKTIVCVVPGDSGAV